MPRIRFTLNAEQRELDVPPDMPLLWALRDHLDAKGTRYSCGQGICGTCTVLVDGAPVRSCITEVAEVDGGEVLTIEGLSPSGDHPVQRAWITEQVPQCGYCQPGQILNAVALLSRNPDPDAPAITEAMDQVLCRCGTYQRIRRAIERAAAEGRHE